MRSAEFQKFAPRPKIMKKSFEEAWCDFPPTFMYAPV